MGAAGPGPGTLKGAGQDALDRDMTEAAREFGFRAYHYHADEHERLLAELRELGIE